MSLLNQHKSIPIKAIVGVVVAANVLLALHSTLANFPSPDEIRQLAAGLSHWRLGSFRLAGEAPPLARLIASAPVLAADHFEWFLGYVERPLYVDRAIEDQIAAFFASENARQLVDMVRLARLPGLAWWLLGAWVIFRWCGTLYGAPAGYLGLVLWSFDPNVLSHESLATPELAASVATLAASYAFWRLLNRSTWEAVAIAGFSLGVALLADFSALLFLALWPALAAFQWLAGRTEGIRSLGLGRAAGQSALLFVLSASVVNSGFWESDPLRPLSTYDFTSHTLGGRSRSPDPFRGNLPVGNRFHGTWLAPLPAPLPHSYLTGLDQRLHALEAADDPRMSGAVPMDEGGRAGRLTLGTRLPIGLLAMILWGAFLSFGPRATRSSRSDQLCWTLPMLAFAGLAILGRSGPQVERGVVLLVPYGIVAASRLGDYLRPRNGLYGGLVLAAVVWDASNGVAASIHPAPFRNELVGRPDYRTIPEDEQEGDGGQELLRLQTWQNNHTEAGPVGVAIHHLIDPRDHGFPASPPPVDPGSSKLFTVDPPPKIGPRPGYYAIDRSTLATSHYSYFREFAPKETIGSSLLIYRIISEGAGQIREKRGAAAAEARKGKYALAFERGIEDESVFQFRVHEGRGQRRTRYAVHVPGSYRVDAPNPLILFLHGVGDSGTDGRQFLNVGLPRIIEQSGDSHGFIVVCPQGRAGNWSPGSEDAEAAMAILAAAQKEFNVDPDRIILTGISSGGTGTWKLAARYPDRWAAIVPISSVGSEQQAAKIQHIPCWCFHNCTDAAFFYHKFHSFGSSVESPRRMIRALVEAGGTPRYTEFLGIGDTHNAWDRAYTMPELYDWLAGQRRH